jgi:phosphoglycerol transferase MdoB-like AlkP superfamily enzyme
MAKKKGARSKGGKPKGGGEGKRRASSKGGKAARPFVIAFVATCAVALLFALFWRAYGWDGYAPRVALSGWPAVGALAVVVFLGVTYWRAGKPAFWGALVATIGAAALLVWATDALPALL